MEVPDQKSGRGVFCVYWSLYQVGQLVGLRVFWDEKESFSIFWNEIFVQDCYGIYSKRLEHVHDFALLSRYAVKFWNQGLHQGSSVLRVDAVTGQDVEEKVNNVFFYPLAVCGVV